MATTLLAIAPGCAVDDSGAAEDTANASGAEAVSGSQVFDHDFAIPAQSVPLSHAFTETLTRYGITVVPTLTPSGTFGLTDADVHVQVDYTSNPPKINRLDVSNRGTWSVDLRFDVDVTAKADWKAQAPDFRKTFTTGTSLGGKAFEIAKVPLASVPLPQAPNIMLQLDLELAASCELDFDAELHAYAEIGLGGLATSDVFYLSSLPQGQRVGFVADSNLTTADEFHITTPPHIAFKDGNLAQVTGRCGVQPSINATAALGVDPTHPLADVGVKFVVQPYAELDGKFNSPDDWSIDAKAGIEGSVSPFGDFFGQPFSTTDKFKLFDFELAEGPTSSSTPAPSAPSDPSGTSGDDDDSASTP